MIWYILAGGASALAVAGGLKSGAIQNGWWMLKNKLSQATGTNKHETTLNAEELADQYQDSEADTGAGTPLDEIPETPVEVQGQRVREALLNEREQAFMNNPLTVSIDTTTLKGRLPAFLPPQPSGVFQPNPKPPSTAVDTLAKSTQSFGSKGQRQQVSDIGTLQKAAKGYAAALLAFMSDKITDVSQLVDPIFRPGGVFCDDNGRELLLRQMETRITRLAGLQTDGWPANNAGIYGPSGGWGDNQWVVPSWTKAEVRKVYENYFQKISPGLWDCRALALEAAVPEFCDAYFRAVRSAQPGFFQALFAGLEGVLSGLVGAFTGTITQGKDLGKELEKAMQASLNTALGQLGKQLDNVVNNYPNWLDVCSKIGKKYAEMKDGFGFSASSENLGLGFGDKCSTPPAYPINQFFGSASHCRLGGPNQGSYPGVLLFAYIGGSTKYAFTTFAADDINGGFWATNPRF